MKIALSKERKHKEGNEKIESYNIKKTGWVLSYSELKRIMTWFQIKVNKKTIKYEQKMNKKLLIFHKSVIFIQK